MKSWPSISGVETFLKLERAPPETCRAESDALPTPVVLADLVDVLESVERPMVEARLLIVADDPDLRATLDEFLAAKGYRTVAAPDDVAAVDAMVEAPPDAVLLDIGAGGISELEALATPAISARASRRR